MIPAHRAPTHPAEILPEHLAAKRGAVAALSRAGMPVSVVNQLLSRERPFDRPVAEDLSRVLGTASVEFWLNLQKNYDLWLSRQFHRSTQKEQSMAKKEKQEALENLVVASKAKDTVKGFDMRSGGEFLEALNAQVHKLIQRAVARAKANDRATLRPEDL